MADRYQNTGELRRHWSTLRNAETGVTLELDPGEDAEVEFPEGFDPEDFNDHYLKPVRVRAPRKPKPSDPPADNPAADTTKDAE